MSLSLKLVSSGRDGRDLVDIALPRGSLCIALGFGCCNEWGQPGSLLALKKSELSWVRVGLQPLVCNFKRDFCRLDLCHKTIIAGLSIDDFLSVSGLFIGRPGCVGKVDNEGLHIIDLHLLLCFLHLQGGGRPLGVLNDCRVSDCINGARVACTAQKEISSVSNCGQLSQDGRVKVIHLGLKGFLGVCLCCSVVEHVLILGLQGLCCVERDKCASLCA